MSCCLNEWTTAQWILLSVCQTGNRHSCDLEKLAVPPPPLPLPPPVPAGFGNETDGRGWGSSAKKQSCIHLLFYFTKIRTLFEWSARAVGQEAVAMHYVFSFNSICTVMQKSIQPPPCRIVVPGGWGRTVCCFIPQPVRLLIKYLAIPE